MSLLFWRRYAVVCLVLFAGLVDVSAAVSYLFGPRVFTAANGKQQIERVTFAAPVPGSYVLHIEARDVTAAVVTLNGATILSPDDFLGPQPTGGVRDIHITLTPVNVLTVEVRSKPGGTLRLSIADTSTPADTTPPTITATAAPTPNAAG